MASELTFDELLAALSWPERFGLKPHVWYALDAPETYLEQFPRWCIATRLGTTAPHLESLFAKWLTVTGKLVIDEKAVIIRKELALLRGKDIELSKTRVAAWQRSTDGQRTALRIRCARRSLTPHAPRSLGRFLPFILSIPRRGCCGRHRSWLSLRTGGGPLRCGRRKVRAAMFLFFV